MTKISPRKSHGTQSIRASLKPRELMHPAPIQSGVWTADIVTLFPDQFPGVLGASLTGKALKDGLWALRTHDLRPYGIGKHKNVDDTPYGGGAGMVMRADVLAPALEHAIGPTSNRPVIYMSPRGKPLTQARAQTLAQGAGAVILCGRFEGVDQRVIDHFNIEELSIGDYILTGGELAAQVLIDSTVRLIPRVLGNQASIENESFSHGLLEHPQYTKPAVWAGRDVPDILLSGHHAHINDWQRDQAERLTKERRPDLWRAYEHAYEHKDPNEDQEL